MKAERIQPEIQITVVLVLLALVTVFTHAMLLPEGMALQNSEWSAFLLSADEYLRGHWMAFPFQQSYGGLTLSFFRSLFSGAWDYFNVDLWHHYKGHVFFSFIVIPWLMAICSYYLVRVYCSGAAALAVGLLAAVGFQHWVFHYGNDFYPAYFMLGCILFSLRKNLENPFVEMNLKKLFLVGILSGHLVYQTAATKIYLLAFFLPWDLAVKNLKEFWKKREEEKILFYLGISCIVFGIYLEIFGRDFGFFFGKMMKLDGEPNLKLGFAFLLLAWLKKFWTKLYEKNLFKRTVVLFCGFIIGNLPEILYWPRHLDLLPTVEFATQDFPVMMKILGVVPQSLRVLMTGEQTFRVFPFLDGGLGQNLSLALGLLALFTFFTTFWQAKKKSSLAPFFLVFTVTLYAYCRVFTRVPEFAPPRYLYPIFPAVILSLGLVWDRYYFSKQKWLKVMIVLLFFGHCIHQVSSRRRLAKTLDEFQMTVEMKDVVETFRKAELMTVVSEDFWYSNNLTVVANWKPGFWSHWREWGPPDVRSRAHEAERVGIILLKDAKRSFPQKSAALIGKDWKLTSLKQTPRLDLYVGERVDRK